MKQFILTLSILIALSITVFAGKPPIKFGDIDINDLKMEKCAFDEGAPAMILCDYATAEVSSSTFDLVFRHHRRIKIFNKQGYDWATAMIRHSSANNIGGLKAVTYYLENGKIQEVKMDKDAIFKEEVSTYERVTRFTLPNVTEGCIIEYTYAIRFSDLFRLKSWSFQSDIPTAHSEYRVSYPNWMEYRVNSPKYISPTEQDLNKSAGIYSWIYKNVPAFKSERLMPNPDNFLPSVSFQLISASFPGGGFQSYLNNWSKIAGELADESNYGVKPRSAPKYAKRAEELCEGITDKMERAKIIYNYVKDSVKWNGRNSAYRLKTLQEIDKEREGNSADISILLMQMLRAVDITSFPVAICTRENGYVFIDYPLADYLDNTIIYAEVDGKGFLLDPTDKNRPFGLLDKNNLNGEGLLVNILTKTYNWVPIQNSVENNTVYFASMSITEDGRLSGKITIGEKGYAAAENRDKITTSGNDEYAKNVFNSLLPEATLKSNEVKNIENLDETLKTILEVYQEGYAEVAGDAIYLNPMLGLNLEENPFKSEKREYPIDFEYSNTESIRIMFSIPEGYELEGEATNVAITLPNKGIIFTYSVSLNGNMLVVSSKLDIQSPLYGVNDYSFIKGLFQEIIAKQGEMIVLKKKA